MEKREEGRWVEVGVKVEGGGGGREKGGKREVAWGVQATQSDQDTMMAPSFSVTSIHCLSFSERE